MKLRFKGIRSNIKIAVVGILTVCCLLPGIPSFSQNVIATAVLDTDAILIGQQTRLRLTVEYKTDQGDIKIDFPKITDTLIKQVEVVEKSKLERFIPDSSDMSRLAQTQTLLITSFDSGYYAIPPFKFIVNGDSGKTVETEPLLFSVNTLAIDTTISIKDIKPPMEVPFSWKELLPYVYGGLGTLAVLAGLFFLLRHYLKKKKTKPVPQIVVPVIPAHVTALEQLQKLKEDKLWQSGKLKEYHSAISDIIRQYIEQRFFINAMEQVSDEILYAFRVVDISEEQKSKLRQILLLSDMVKFAKEQPLPYENDLSWNNAYEFVMASKQENVKEDVTPSAPERQPNTLNESGN